jgi:hypothetical protein
MSSPDFAFELNNANSIKLDKLQFQKMIFIMNALDTGWSVKKNEESYIFTKKHENKREVFMEKYLENFIVSNMKLDKSDK